MIAKDKIPIYQRASFALFTISVTLGYLSAYFNPETARSIVFEALKGFDFVKEMNSLEILLFIFLNNAGKSLLAIILGVFFAPIVFIIVNGLLLGMVVRVVGTTIGYLEILATLMAHGIFELPAVLIAAGYGWWFGIQVWKKIFGQNPEFEIKEGFTFILKRFLKIVVPILAVAAFIETFISPQLMKYLE